MSYYVACLLKDQAILALDRRVAHWARRDDGPVMKTVDSTDPKYYQLSKHVVFFPPCNGLAGEPLACLLKDAFGNFSVDMESFVKNRFALQREGKKIIEESREATRETLDAQGLSEDDLGVPLLTNVDCICGGVDVADQPFLIDFREGFEFEVHRPGTALACDMGVEINRWIEGRVDYFLKVAGHRILYHRLLCHLSARQRFRRDLALRIFQRIFKFVSKCDEKVSRQFDIIFIDRDGCKAYHSS